MIRWVLRRQITAFERAWNYDSSYMHDVLDADPRAIWAFSKAMGFARSRKDVPLDAYYAAKITGTMAEDCGPCTQLVADMATRAGVDAPTLKAIVSGDLSAMPDGVVLAVRFTRNYPQKVDRLVLEAPIGLEDYRFYVLPIDTRHLIEREHNLSAADYRQQLITNYSISLPPQAIETFVEIRERVKGSGEYDRWLRSFVNSYQMIYREPVVHEIPLITQETLFIMGANDHNAPGRAFAPPEARAKMGQNAELAKELASHMRVARVSVVTGVGHLVHLEAEGQFNDLLLRFLGEMR